MTYPNWFEQLWQIFPKRAGGNPKNKALKALNARIKQGDTLEDIYQGLIRYKNYCEAMNLIKTPYVKQAATFFGPDQSYLEEWEIPNETSNRGLSAVERVKQANIHNGYTETHHSPPMGSYDTDVRGIMAPQLRLIGH